MSQSPPNILGKYQIIREIARSNDIVYEAYDPVMNRRVAVKELAIPGGSSPQQREDRLKRFLREAKAAGSLVHPNIVTIYEVGEHDGRTYIAMEFLDGHTLRKDIETTGFLDPAKAVDVTIEVLQGLKFAHEHGVIHRDIKPENVQILSSGKVKLTDFGIARLTFEPNLTMDGQVFGTPSYMSPEQINGKEIDARSDLFSVGVMLYEMVSGQKPFPGDSVVSISYSIMNREPVQPAQANHALWSVLMAALDKSPVLRYDHADSMIAALENVKRGMASGSVVLDPPTAPTNYNIPPAGLVNPYPPPQVVAPPVAAPQPYGQPSLQPYGMAAQPYGAQPYGQTAPYNPPQIPQGVPAYYPPPTRRPLFKEATKQFFVRLIFALLLMATLVVLIVVGINGLSEAVRGDEASAKTPTKPDAGVPTSAPSATDSGLATGAPPASADRSSPAAVSGPASAVPGADANSLIRDARDDISLAMREDFQQRRESLWQEAEDNYGKAVQVEPGRAQEINRLAVNDFVSASDQLASDRPKWAREALYKASDFAGNDPDAAAAINQRLQTLGG